MAIHSVNVDACLDIELRKCKYLNNIVEQDHRAVKRVTAPMLGFKSFWSAQNVSDISQTPALLHGQESDVWADAGYVGVEKREDLQEALAANEQEVRWHIAKRRKTIFKYKETRYKGLAKNDAQLNVLFGLSNLYMARGELRP